VRGGRKISQITKKFFPPDGAFKAAESSLGKRRKMVRHIRKLSAEHYCEVRVWLSTGIIFLCWGTSAAADAILRK
jgi:hypothetical protein